MQPSINNKIEEVLNKVDGFRELCLVLLSKLEKYDKIHGKGKSELFLVGGTVRELVEHLINGAPECKEGESLGKQVFFCDIDLMITNIDYSSLGKLLRELRKSLPKKILRVVGVGKSFPVYKVSTTWFEKEVDIALARTENSTGHGHLDFIVNTNSVTAKDDAARRDLTINAIFVKIFKDNGRINCELTDYFGGIGSIRRMEVKAVLSPYRRFNEDPLRILRAIRQKIKHPMYTIEVKTKKAIQELAPKLIKTISQERISEEFLKSLKLSAKQTLLEFRSLGVLGEVIPEIEELKSPSWEILLKRMDFISRKTGQQPTSLILASLFVEISLDELMKHSQANVSICTECAVLYGIKNAARVSGRIGKRLKFPDVKGIEKLIFNLLKMLHYQKLPFPKANIEEALKDSHVEAITLYKAHQKASSATVEDFDKLITSFKLIPKNISGSDLINAGISPGPQVQKILYAIREQELNGAIHSKAEGIYAAKLMANNSVTP